jgi:alkylhydroperoxidase family enzyme
MGPASGDPSRRLKTLQRIQGASNPPLAVRLAARAAPRAVRKLTGRDPQNDNLVQALMIWAHKPRLMLAMGRYSRALRKPGCLDQRLRHLVQMRAGEMIGCAFTVDMGAQICRNAGLSDTEILALRDYGNSDLFDDREKAALDFTVATMQTPVAMTDGIFERAHGLFSNQELVELAALLTLVNVERFYAAFGVGSAGFSGQPGPPVLSHTTERAA